MPTIEGQCAIFREALKKLEEIARLFSNNLKNADLEYNKWECIAQSILAIRHLEDARMRYWKVIQYLWDGVSKFDK